MNFKTASLLSVFFAFIAVPLAESALSIEGGRDVTVLVGENATFSFRVSGGNNASEISIGKFSTASSLSKEYYKLSFRDPANPTIANDSRVVVTRAALHGGVAEFVIVKATKADEGLYGVAMLSTTPGDTAHYYNTSKLTVNEPTTSPPTTSVTTPPVTTGAATTGAIGIIGSLLSVFLALLF